MPNKIEIDSFLDHFLKYLPKMAVLIQISLLKKYQKQTRKAVFYHFGQQVSMTRSTVLQPVRSFVELTWAKVYISLEKEP